MERPLVSAPVPRPALALLLACVAVALLPGTASARYTFALASGRATLTGDAASDGLAIKATRLTSTLVVLQHNRFGVDPGLASSTDWDTTASGTQLLANSGSVTVAIHGDAGADFVRLGGDAGRASDLLAGFSLDLGSHPSGSFDSVRISNEAGAATAATLDRDSTGAFISGYGRLVRHMGIEKIFLDESTGADSVLIRALSTGLRVDGGPGADTTTIDASSRVTGFVSLSVVELADDGAVDRVVADAARATAGATMRLSEFDLRAANVIGNYGSRILPQVRGGPGPDAIEVAGTVAGQVPIVDTGGGADMVRVAGHDGVQPGTSLDVRMGDGADTLQVDNSASSAPDGWHTTTATVHQSGPRGASDITQTGAETVDLRASGGPSTFDVRNPGATFVTDIRAGGGDDVVAWQPGSPVGTVDGAAGRDRLDFRSFTTPVTADLSSAAIAGATDVGGFEDLHGGSGADHLTGLPGAPGSRLDGGRGNDTLIGGTGDDSLTGAQGDDDARGGDGQDVYVVNVNDVADELDRFDGGAGTDGVEWRGGLFAEDIVVGPSGDVDRPLELRNAPADDRADPGALLTASIERFKFAGDFGNDRVRAQPGIGPVAFAVDGGEGDDDVQSGIGDDTLSGGPGDDRLSGGHGEDALQGGDGDDTIAWAPADGPVHDSVDGGPGSDTFDYTGTDARDVLALAPATGGGAAVSAPEGAPVNVSLAATERVVAALGGGDDEVRSSLTAATPLALALAGGPGADLLGGGPGADRLQGDAGEDDLRGAGGDDRLVGGDGADRLSGGGGYDAVDYSANADAAGVTVDIDGTADDGNARDEGAGGRRDDVRTDIEELIGTSAGDRLTGGTDNDVLVGRFGPDDLSGGPGIDTADFRDAFGAVTADIDGVADDGDVADQAGGRGDNVKTDVENLRGGFNDDHLTGNAGANVLDGAGGGDVLSGGAGIDAVTYASRRTGVIADADGLADDGEDADAFEAVHRDTIQPDVENLIGGSGPDLLTGDDAANLLDGGPGPDRMSGGGGVDTVTYRGRTGAVVADLEGDADDGDASDEPNPPGAAGQLPHDEIGADVENLTGGAGADQLTGNGGDNVLDGGQGADVLAGGGGTDTATYAGRTNPVTADLDGVADDGIAGEKDNVLPDIENLTGGNGADTLTGGAGPNLFRGGPGADVFNGLGGADTVTYSERVRSVTVDIDGTADDGNATDVTGTLHDLVATDVENLIGGGGADILVGSDADNFIDARDRARDTIVCLDGADTVAADPGDFVDTPGCETVVAPDDP